MDSIYAIAMGLGLRLSVALIVPRLDAKISGTIIGLWEGACLHYFTTKWRTSSDPYVAYAFRLFVDYIFTEDVLKLTVVMLWTGLGVLLADIVPGMWVDSGMAKAWARLGKHSTVRRTTALFTARNGSIANGNGNGNIGTSRGVHFEPPSPVIVDSSVASTPIASGINLRNINPPTLFPPRKYVPGAYSNTDMTSESGRSNAESILPVPIPSPSRLRDISEEDNLLNDDGQRTPRQRATFVGEDPTDFELEYMDDNELQPAFHKLLEIPEDRAAIPPEPQLVIPKFKPRPEIPPHPHPALPFIELSPKEKRKVLPPIPGPDDATEEIVPREGIPPQPEIVIPTFEPQDRPPIPPQPEIIIPKIEPSPAQRPLSKALPDLPAGDDGEDTAAGKRRTLPPAYTDGDWEHVEIPDAKNGGEKAKENGDVDVDVDEEAGPSNRLSEELDSKSLVASDGDTFSVISADGRSTIITKADLLRTQARAEEKMAAELTMQSRGLKAQGLIKEAFIMQTQADEALALSKKLHERAARRYFHANNRNLSTRVIDVHGLKVPEAVRQTEKALRDVLVQGGTQLRVVVGQGKHSSGKVPILKLALIRAMQGHGIPAVVDKFNPGLLVITL